MLISIITPCLNRASMVATAIKSVLHQDYAPIEHIIMDGGSTDGTLEVLRGYPHLRVISQPDQGLYDAINNGIQIAKGEMIGVLNTDDYYSTNVFGTVANIFTERPEIEAVSGGASIFQIETNGEIKILHEYLCIKQDTLWVRATREESSFNAWFFRKRLFSSIGPLDIQYRYLADRDFLIRLAKSGTCIASIDQTIYNYQRHPGSLTMSGKGLAITPVGLEARNLSENYLDGKSLRKDEKKALQKWHTQVTLGQTFVAMHSRTFSNAIGHAIQGLKYNPFWWLEFAIHFPPRLGRLVLKKTGLYQDDTF